MSMGEKPVGVGRVWLRVILIVALVVKVGMAGVWTGGLLTAREVSAADTSGSSSARGSEPSKPVAPMAKKRPVLDLLSDLEQRQQELDMREQELEQRAARLKVLEQDVTSKIATLEEIEKRLSGEAETRRTSGAEAAQSLAKIYAAMKPADAAPILDQLDDRTILTIFRRMKEKQIGEILPLMSRSRAIVLTQAIALRR